MDEVGGGLCWLLPFGVRDDDARTTVRGTDGV
jgi:hypothetical protein